MITKFLGALSLEYAAAKINILTSDMIRDLLEAFKRLNRWTALSSETSIDINSFALAVISGRGPEYYILLEEEEVEAVYDARFVDDRDMYKVSGRTNVGHLKLVLI